MGSFLARLIHTKCDHFNIIGEQIVKLLVTRALSYIRLTLCLTSSHTVVNAVLKHPKLHSFLGMRHQVLYPYKKELRIILYS